MEIEIAEPQPDPEEVVVLPTTIESLPDEVLSTIFQSLPISQKRNGRLVCKSWRELINQHLSVVFNVVLNNETAPLVQNPTFPTINCLKLKDLTTTEFNFLSLSSTTKVIISGCNSSMYFWNAIRYCAEGRVEYLEFEESHCSIPSLENCISSLQLSRRATFAHLKILVFKVILYSTKGNYGDNPNLPTYPEGGKNLKDFLTFSCEQITQLQEFKLDIKCHDEFDDGSQFDDLFPAIYSFISQRPTIKKFDLKVFHKNYHAVGMGLMIPVAIHQPGGDLPLLFQPQAQGFGLDEDEDQDGLSAVERSPNSGPIMIEELILDFDFSRHKQIHELIRGCQHLRKLHVSHPEPTRRHYYNQNGAGNIVLKLIQQNSSTLEALSIKTYQINFESLRLHNCLVLKRLDLDTPSLTNVPVDSPQVRLTCTQLGLHGKLKREEHIVNRFLMIQGLLELTKRNLEQLTLRAGHICDVNQLIWLANLRKIKQIVLSRVSEAKSGVIQDFCEGQMDGFMKTRRIRNDENKIDFVITIL